MAVVFIFGWTDTSGVHSGDVPGRGPWGAHSKVMPPQEVAACSWLAAFFFRTPGLAQTSPALTRSHRGTSSAFSPPPPGPCQVFLEFCESPGVPQVSSQRASLIPFSSLQPVFPTSQPHSCSPGKDTACWVLFPSLAGPIVFQAPLGGLWSLLPG